MKYLLAGGSGQIGEMLFRHWDAQGHEVVNLTRRSAESTGKSLARPRQVHWDGQSVGAWASELESADVLVNLAGRSVNCRYNETNRATILNSRVDSTRALGQAMQAATDPPKLWLQSSTATIYAHRFDAANDESTGILGVGNADAPDTWQFSFDVASAWESAATDFQRVGVRQVLLRSAVVMSPDKDGVFDVLCGLAKTGLGGTNGNGKQYVSWIHEIDFCRSMDWLVENDSLEGAVNIASPNPLVNREFMAALREALGVSIGLPAGRWMLEIGAYFMKTETELLLKSRRVVPGRLLESGFQFNFSEWSSAAKELAGRWK